MTLPGPVLSRRASGSTTTGPAAQPAHDRAGAAGAADGNDHSSPQLPRSSALPNEPRKGHPGAPAHGRPEVDQRCLGVRNGRIDAAIAIARKTGPTLMSPLASKSPTASTDDHRRPTTSRIRLERHIGAVHQHPCPRWPRTACTLGSSPCIHQTRAAEPRGQRPAPRHSHLRGHCRTIPAAKRSPATGAWRLVGACEASPAQGRGRGDGSASSPAASSRFRGVPERLRVIPQLRIDSSVRRTAVRISKSAARREPHHPTV